MHIKRPLVILAFSFFYLTSCHNKTSSNQSTTFELSGTLAGGGEGIMIYLDRLDLDGVKHMDSTKIDKNGAFYFHTLGIIKGFYNLRITKDDYAMLILDSNEKVHVEGNSQSIGYTYSASGSPDSKKFIDFNRLSTTYNNKMDSLEKHAQAVANILGGNKKRLDSLNNSLEGPYDTLIAKHERFVTSFIKDNPGYFAALAAIEELSPDKYLSYYILLDSGLSKNYPNSMFVKHFHDEVTGYKRVAIGAPAPEISLPDTNGKIVTLSSFKGKVVLIDFWASGYPPSISTLAEIVKTYHKFGDKKFTVLSISLDKDKAAWIAGIHKYHLNWTHVIEAERKNSKVLPAYNFDKLPFNILISADGRIAGKNLTDDNMEAEIEQILTPSKTHS